ncbi:MAG: Crp/Fnr family transcriptional regulator [Bacteroidia bacterium]|nr:Crp/Fnr family transcriptional regulator [Bacteroidia bacterium]
MSLNQNIPAEVLSDEISQLPTRTYHAGRNWNLFGSSDNKVYWLKSGIVKVGCYTSEGIEDLRFLIQGQTMLGEMAVLGNGNPDDFAIAITDCQICEIDAITLSKLLSYNPDFQVWLMELMRTRLALLEKRLQAILFQPSKDRVLSFLQDYFLEFGQVENNMLRVPSYLSHTDIAQFTSTSRQTVNRVLNQLRKEGLLDYDKETLWIAQDNLSRMFD